MGWDKESLAAFVASLQADPKRIFPSSYELADNLVEALTSNDVEIRKGAVVALSKIVEVYEPEQSVRDGLKKALQDKDPEVRLRAAEALQNGIAAKCRWDFCGNSGL
jgi:HEAT repeat protein